MRRPFRPPDERTEDSDFDDGAAAEALEEVQAEAREPLEPAPGDAAREVKEAKFTLMVEEQAVTVVLYVSRAWEETLIVAVNAVATRAKGGRSIR
jgi:hypothetical protein